MPIPQPKHIAIILDGNRRWARAHGLGILSGHDHVVNTIIEPLVDRCIELNIPFLTLWAFSTENWGRDPKEIKGIMHIFRQAFKKKVSDLNEKGVRLNVIGDLSRFPEDIQKHSMEWISRSQKNTKITVNFALNYGGRDEVLRAIRRIVSVYPNLKPNDVTEDLISGHLDTAGIPDPDLVIRPSGQLRLSGFMPWQCVYSELYFTNIHIPDFSVAELDKALADFRQRKRRFGK